jgi:hypothetical protein
MLDNLYLSGTRFESRLGHCQQTRVFGGFGQPLQGQYFSIQFDHFLPSLLLYGILAYNQISLTATLDAPPLR